MSDQDTDQRITENRLKRMLADFVPAGTRTTPVDAQDRVAHALEYIAFQLGQIARKLDAKV